MIRENKGGYPAGRCSACKHWGGDKRESKRLFEENNISMDLKEGWPNYGGCGIDHEWLETDIRGDALVLHEVPANFGCVYYTTPW